MYDVSDLYLPHAQRDAALRHLRQEEPVAFDEANDLWYVTRHEDVAHASRHPELFSSAQGISYFDAVPLGMVTMDDPDHARLRRIVSKAFSPRMVVRLREATEQYTNECLDRVVADGEADFVEAVAAPVTLRIIADMLGIPHEELDDVRDWTDTMMDAGGRLEEDGVAESAAVAFVNWTTYVSEHITRRVADPGEDLLSALAHADDEALDLEELAMFATLLMVAGNETTRHTATRGLEALIHHPEQLRKLAENPSMGKVAVEEILRFTSVARGMMRTVVEDTRLHDVPLAAGDRVFLLYPSANRDAEVFVDPDTFDITRQDNPHLAFGIGTHFCIGAGLARMELDAIFSTVLRRLPEVEQVPGTEAVHRANALVAGVAEFPVRWKTD